jgi:hypothetical protein
MLDQLRALRTTLSASPHRIYLAILIALMVFWIGAAHSAVSANECDGGAYRNLSFAELAYSDIAALHADRGCRPHQTPYVRDRVEYPVLLTFTMWAPSQLGSTGTGYFLLTATLLAISVIVMGLALFRIPGANPWIMMASPALFVYGTLNWDLIALALLAVGLALIPRGTTAVPQSGGIPKVFYWAMLFLSLAVWTKLFPVVGVWALLVVVLHQYGLKPAVGLGVLFALVSIVLNAPFAAMAFENWSYFFKFNGIRDIDPSLYTLAGLDPKRDVAIANKLSFLLLSLSALFVWGVVWKKKLGQVGALTGFLLIVWMFGNKVFSPQYWIWALFGYAIAGGRTWLGLLAGALATLEHFAVFSILSQKGYGFLLDLQPWFKERYWDCVHLRYVMFFVLMADILFSLFRKNSVGEAARLSESEAAPAS